VTKSLKILFGHPGGAPHSHNAALAHFEAGRLEAFCVPWMPTPGQLALVSKLPGLGNWSARLRRRSFPPLLKAPKVEGKVSEWIRLAKRVLLGNRISSERLAYEANDWLMKTMSNECARPTVTAVHSYEDCSLLQFHEAKKRGKACIYDMPIGYYPAWEETQNRLVAEFSDWLPDGKLPSRKYVRPAQKKMEMELADLVVGPCSFVAETIRKFVDKPFAIAPYGVDPEFWRPSEEGSNNRPLRFIYAGQSSIRKGIPFLLRAWKKAALKNAELFLIGSWQLAENRLRDLPEGVTVRSPCSAVELRSHYQSADVFVFPSYFEGFGLVLLEAMACGLPVLATERTAAPDFISDHNGLVVPAGDVDAWIAALRSVLADRAKWQSMRKSARGTAVENDWKHYRNTLSTAIGRFFL
jgi:starch synthase